MQGGHPGLVGPPVEGRHVREPRRSKSDCPSRFGRPNAAKRACTRTLLEGPHGPDFGVGKCRVQRRRPLGVGATELPMGLLVSGCSTGQIPSFSPRPMRRRPPLATRDARGSPGRLCPGFQRRRCPQRTRPFWDGAPLQQQSWRRSRSCARACPRFSLEVGFQNFSLVGHALQGRFLHTASVFSAVAFMSKNLVRPRRFFQRKAWASSNVAIPNLQFSTFEIGGTGENAFPQACPLDAMRLSIEVRITFVPMSKSAPKRSDDHLRPALRQWPDSPGTHCRCVPPCGHPRPAPAQHGRGRALDLWER